MSPARALGEDRPHPQVPPEESENRIKAALAYFSINKGSRKTQCLVNGARSLGSHGQRDVTKSPRATPLSPLDRSFSLGDCGNRPWSGTGRGETSKHTLGESHSEWGQAARLLSPRAGTSGTAPVPRPSAAPRRPGPSCQGDRHAPSPLATWQAPCPSLHTPATSCPSEVSFKVT